MNRYQSSANEPGLSSLRSTRAMSPSTTLAVICSPSRTRLVANTRAVSCRDTAHMATAQSTRSSPSESGVLNTRPTLLMSTARRPAAAKASTKIHRSTGARMTVITPCRITYSTSIRQPPKRTCCQAARGRSVTRVGKVTLAGRRVLGTGVAPGGDVDGDHWPRATRVAKRAQQRAPGMSF